MTMIRSSLILVAIVSCLATAVEYDKELYAIYDSVTQDIRIVAEKPHVNESIALIGWGGFANEINSTGWARLEIRTNSNVSDSLQAYSAGLIEANLSSDLIKLHWNNVVGNDFCGQREDFCRRLEDFLAANLDYVRSNIEAKRVSDPYWHQVGLVYEQLAGLDDGFRGLIRQPHSNISIFGLHLMNIMGDLEDLDAVLGEGQTFSGRMRRSGHCSALIKILANNSDIFVSQDTWNDYSSMLRILKLYDLGYHNLPKRDSPVISGPSASFSSYPGLIQSGDDFYVISSGLVSMETTIGNNNGDLYKRIKPSGIVLEWIRSLVANRLSSSGLQWSRLFALHNSGTYNNQWMIVDYKLFQPGQTPPNNFLYVIEQIPTLVMYDDLTRVLVNQTYWPSYNTPYFETVFNLSGGPANVEKYGDWFTYDKTPRALIFKRDHGKVKETESMIKLMRYNDYKNDPLSACKCLPPYSAENAISARSDLNPANGTYPFSALGHRSHGATDMKLTSNSLRKTLNFIAISGPPHDDVPAFVWSQSDFRNTAGHEGHPDIWIFPPVTTEWSLSKFP